MIDRDTIIPSRTDVLSMAREADATGYGDELTGDAIERFAELVAAVAVEREREACAKVCEEQRDLREEARAALRVAGAFKEGNGDAMLRAMRHESNVRLYHAGIDQCAAAIRARSNT